MKRLIESLRSVRKAELLILTVFLCVGLMVLLNGTREADMSVEGRMCAILSNIEGAGKVHVMLSTDAEGGCTGAVITAEGADDVRTMLEIQRAVRTLTGLPLERIEIVKSGK